MQGTQLKELGCGCLVHFVINANYMSLFSMELEKINCLCLQTTKVNFEKLVGWQVSKNHNKLQSASIVFKFVHPSVQRK